MIYVASGCQAALIGVFLFSIAGKVRSRHAYHDFVSSLVAMRVLPERWTRPAAIATIAGETLTVPLLAIPATVPVGFLVAAGLLTIFTAAILAALRRGELAPCRCFGASTTPLGKIHVVRNMVLFTACLAGLFSVVNEGGSTWHPGGLLLSWMVAATLVLFVVRLDDLVHLFEG